MLSKEREFQIYQDYDIKIERNIIGNTMILRISTTYPIFDVIDTISKTDKVSCARENDCKDLVLKIKNINLDNRSDKLEAIESLEFTLKENLKKIIQVIDGFRKLEEYDVIEEPCKLVEDEKEEDVPEFLKRNYIAIRGILKEIGLLDEKDKNKLKFLLKAVI